MRTGIGTVGLALVALSAATPVRAQGRFGAQLNFAEDADFGLGARVGFALGGELKRKGIEGLVTFDYFFPKAYDYWTVTADGLYHFTPANSSVNPYVGGGVSLGHGSVGGVSPGLSRGGSDVGLNLMAGLRFKAQERLLPFAEARYELKNGGQFILSAGVYFGKA